MGCGCSDSGNAPTLTKSGSREGDVRVQKCNCGAGDAASGQCRCKEGRRKQRGQETSSTPPRGERSLRSNSMRRLEPMWGGIAALRDQNGGEGARRANGTPESRVKGLAPSAGDKGGRSGNRPSESEGVRLNPGLPAGSAQPQPGDQPAVMIGPPKIAKCGVGMLPTGLLRANGNIPRDFNRIRDEARLLPGLSLMLPESGNALPLADEVFRQAQANRGSLLRPNKSDKQTLLPLSGPQKGFVRAMYPYGPGMVVLESILEGEEEDRLAILGPGDGGPFPDPPEGRGGGTSDPLPFGYRDQWFEVPGDWYAEWIADHAEVYKVPTYVSHGKVSSVDTTLDALWYPFRSIAEGVETDFDELVGCYNLDWDEDEFKWVYAFNFWSNSPCAPLYVHRYACQLLLTFWSDIDYRDFEDIDDPFALCEGLGTFIRKLLRGDNASRSSESNDSSGEESCFLTMQYRNSERGFDRFRNDCEDNVDCDVGFNPPGGNAACLGEKYEDFVLGWVDSENCYTGDGSSTNCDGPVPGCDNAALGGNWRIVFHPIDLAFRGLVCDRIMHLARMCMDYAFDAGDLSIQLQYMDTASNLSRYALGIVARHASTMVHELGHVYLGSGHCADERNCCFDHAADAWLCRVRAKLGLPVNEWEHRASGDFANPDGLWEDRCASCSTDDGVERKKWVRCDTGTDGKVGETADFVAYPCWGEDQWVDCDPGGGDGIKPAPVDKDPRPTRPEELEK